ncbi:MAG: hypothetical protein QNJ34_07905 [Xenococcaceae cyanobacterium MO_188.B29]|nr:hypothetical protein [Xenococcaceae cyanobacterium MO_188.B29]
MEVRELKFLLKLAALPEYKGKIGELKPTSRTKIADTEKICRRLYDRALVEYQEQITKFKLSSVGKALLKLDIQKLPLTGAELVVLQACSQAIITPQKIKVTPTETRNKLISSLIERGLITVVTTKIKQVCLTDKGKQYLLREYNPQGHYPVLSLDLLNNYLYLFRQQNALVIGQKIKSGKTIGNREQECIRVHEANTIRSFAEVSSPLSSAPREAAALVNNSNRRQKIDFSSHYGKTAPISDEQVLQTILDLDLQLNTNNYLPIFYLREKLQPFLSREELDLTLYRLQRQDKLELSSIVESSKYTHEQLKAGIPQNIGGCLFFLIVVKEN